MVAGDVLLGDAGVAGPCSPLLPSGCSDVLRFFNNGDGTSSAYLLLSDDPGTEPSDTGIPVTIQPVNFTMDEVGGPLYTAGGATYLIASDTVPNADTPEPATWWLTGGACLMSWLSIAGRRERPQGFRSIG